jgi:DNA-binding transcriptional LysR family regulator
MFSFEDELRAAAHDEQTNELLAGLKRISDAAGITAQTYQAQSLAEVCDIIAGWCRRARAHDLAHDHAREARLSAEDLHGPPADVIDRLTVRGLTELTRQPEPSSVIGGETREFLAAESVAAGQAVTFIPESGSVRLWRHGDPVPPFGIAVLSGGTGDHVPLLGPGGR